jgi:hypothetical protein
MKIKTNLLWLILCWWRRPNRFKCTEWGVHTLKRFTLSLMSSGCWSKIFLTTVRSPVQHARLKWGNLCVPNSKVAFNQHNTRTYATFSFIFPPSSSLFLVDIPRLIQIIVVTNWDVTESDDEQLRVEICYFFFKPRLPFGGGFICHQRRFFFFWSWCCVLIDLCSTGIVRLLSKWQPPNKHTSHRSSSKV